MKYDAIVIGVSSGGMNAMKLMFSLFPGDFKIPIVIVQHINSRSDNQWIEILDKKSNIRVKEADEKEKIKEGYVYIAPANYHLLIEKDRTFSFTVDERVNFARPSIDVLFESAAEAYKSRLIGVILTGSSNDGSKGLKQIAEHGGLTIVQNPETAESSYMPEYARTIIEPDYVLSLEDIVKLLIEIDKQKTLLP